MKTALLFPPQWFPSQPYLAAPTLKGYLEQKGLKVDQFDLNIESYDIFLSRPYLEYCVDKIKYRLDAPAQTPSERDVKQVYRQILSDTDFLENILSEVDSAKEVLRSEELFFQFPIYKQAYTALKIAMQLVSFAHFPTKLDLESLYMEGVPEDHLPGILGATQDPIRNPYYDLFENFILPKMDFNSYGLIGISIIHVGQVIPALTLSRFIRQKYPDIHISIGGSVFNRHADVLYDKQPLFREFFHSVVLYEGELPLEKLIGQVSTGGSLDSVPNLIYLKDGVVTRNESAKSLPYELLARPNFDQLPLEKYFMPTPVLPYMASRGCYWGKCTFCTHSFIYDSYYRKENEERVAEDLAYFAERYGVKHFTFSDEAVSPNAFQRMSKAIMAQKVDMKALAMIKFESNTVENQKLFDEMYEAGFVMLFFGLESANDRILNLIEKGTDKATEQKVLEDASCAGIWNHTYMFFGFPTEEREEAEETVEFIVDNSEARSGNIHSVGQSTFTLEKDSAVFHNPSKFSIDRIIKKPERDLSIMYDYDIQVGMGKDEINEVYEKFNRVIDECYPSSKIWKFLSREHFLLYLDKFGKEEIMNMAGDEELVDA
jgi:uncharacterized Fe-S cluster-containing MiaB family protein